MSSTNMVCDCMSSRQAYGNKAKHAPSTLYSEKKSRFRPTVKTSTGARLPICSCLMAPTSIMPWSKMASVGGIGSMRQVIPCWQGWRMKHERGGKDCGLRY